MTARAIHPAARIGHVHLKVADLERALGFYRDVLGLEVTPALRAAGGLSFRRRVSSSHRLEHLGKRGRRTSGGGNNRSLSRGDPLSDAGGVGRRVAASAQGQHYAGRSLGSWRERSVVFARSGWQRAWNYTGIGQRKNGRARRTADWRCSRGRSTWNRSWRGPVGFQWLKELRATAPARCSRPALSGRPRFTANRRYTATERRGYRKRRGTGVYARVFLAVGKFYLRRRKKSVKYLTRWLKILQRP